MGPFEVAGYDVLAPLGTSGRSWLAWCQADRARVVLRRVGRAGLVDVARLRRNAAMWCSLPGGHVLAVRDVVVANELVVVVSDHATGGGLDGLLARRGPLADGELVTMVTPLADTLAAAHAHGLWHGRVSAGNVLFDARGRPLLGEVAFGSAQGSPADDVAALIAVALAASRGDGPVRSALHGLGGEAADLATAVRGAAAAAPVGLRPVPIVDEFAPTAATSPTNTARHRRAVLGIVAAAAVALVGVVAATRAAPHPPPAVIVPARPPATSPVDRPSPSATIASPADGGAVSWMSVARDLERRRVAAFVALDPVLLARVETSGPALRRDAATLATLRARHLHPVGLRAVVAAAHVVVEARDWARLRVVDALSAYRLVAQDGSVVASYPARARRSVVLGLVRSAVGWRIRSVSR